MCEYADVNGCLACVDGCKDITDDPALYCQYCGAQRKESCTCGPIADK